MTLHDYFELCAYWGDHPPVHMLIAAGTGWKPRGKVRCPNRSTLPNGSVHPEGAPGDIGALIGLAPNGIGSVEALKGLG